MPVFLLPTSSFLLFIDVCVQASSCFKLLWQLFTSYTHYICSFIKFQFVVLRDLKQFSIHYSTVFLFSAFFFNCLHNQPCRAKKSWIFQGVVQEYMQKLCSHRYAHAHSTSFTCDRNSISSLYPASFFFFFLLKQLFS